MAKKPETDNARTVVLTKPNDLLLIGNCGATAYCITADQVKTATQLFAGLGITVVFFVDDIDISKLSADA